MGLPPKPVSKLFFDKQNTSIIVYNFGPIKSFELSMPSYWIVLSIGIRLNLGPFKLVTIAHPLVTVILATLSWLGLRVVCVPSLLTSASSWFKVTNSASTPTTSPSSGISANESGVNVTGDCTGRGWCVSASNTEGSSWHETAKGRREYDWTACSYNLQSIKLVSI